MNYWIVLFLIIALVGADKALTAANLIVVQNNFPEANHLKLEKNPIARWFMEKFGLIGGNIIYALITIITTMIAFFLLSKVTYMNEYRALYGICMLYAFVIMNNFYFLLKFGKVI